MNVPLLILCLKNQITGLRTLINVIRLQRFIIFILLFSFKLNRVKLYWNQELRRNFFEFQLISH